MNFFDAFFLGIIEGLTEFLPISSTAHLLFTAQLLRIPESEFLKSFIIAIQLGAVFAILALYGKRLRKDRETNLRLLTAFFPTALIGLLLYNLIKGTFFENTAVSVAALGLGGIIMLLVEFLKKPASDEEGGTSAISYRKAFLIGCAQALAVIPGVSRAAATIVGGIALGVGRKTIVEFSFLLAVPTIAAAAGYDLLKTAYVFSGEELAYLSIGFLTSFLSALFAIRFFLRYIARHTLLGFGVYRVVLALLLLTLLF